MVENDRRRSPCILESEKSKKKLVGKKSSDVDNYRSKQDDSVSDSSGEESESSSSSAPSDSDESTGSGDDGDSTSSSSSSSNSSDTLIDKPKKKIS